MESKYSKEMFESDLNQLILENGYDPVLVAKYTSKQFGLRQADIDLYLRKKMLDIMTMEDGPEFEMSEDEFNEFIKNM